MSAKMSENNDKHVLHPPAFLQKLDQNAIYCI